MKPELSYDAERDINEDLARYQEWLHELISRLVAKHASSGSNAIQSLEASVRE